MPNQYVSRAKQESNNFKIKNETMVRDFMRDQFPHIFWIEQRRGSSHGFPDCIVNVDGHGAFIELKASWMFDLTWDMHKNPGEIHASQLIMHRKIMESGMLSFVLVGSISDGQYGICTGKNLVNVWTSGGSNVKMLKICTCEDISVFVRVARGAG